MNPIVLHIRSRCPTGALVVILTASHAAAAPSQRSAGDDGSLAAIGTSINYQGVLKQGGSPFIGVCDLQFSLWTAASAGTQIGSTQTFTAQSIVDGQVTGAPDFGALAFDGNDRWLEIAVRTPAGSGDYVTLTPRQKIGAVPYALFAIGGNTGFTLPYGTSFTSSTSDGLTITNHFGGSGGYSGRLGGPGYGVVGKHNATGNLGYVGHADYGVFGIAESSVDISVRGMHTATGNEGQMGAPYEGVFGRHGPSGNYGTLGQSNAGVFAFGNNASALYAQHGPTTNYALLGHSDYGVDGVVTGAEDTGARGYHGPTGNFGSLGRFDYGVLGNANSALATGVFGVNQISGNWGALGRGDVGVYGSTTATNGIGVFGAAAGANVVAVRGVRGAATGELGSTAGVVGVYQSGITNNWATIGSGSTAINAFSANSTAIFAISEASANPGLRVQNLSGGHAAEFVGNVQIYNGCLDGCLSDLAEAFAIVGVRDHYEPADVVSIALDEDGIERSREPYSTLVCGIYSTAPGIVLGGADADTRLGQWIPVALVGVVPTRISIENGSIRRGDLLVTSSTPGHAMKGTDRDRMLGAILGKALENFDGVDGQTTGIIQVMVNCK